MNFKAFSDLEELEVMYNFLLVEAQNIQKRMEDIKRGEK